MEPFIFLKSNIFWSNWILLAMTCVKAFNGRSSETLLPALISSAAAILASGVILLSAVPG
jgi:FtsH-binding integral membrane protein